MAVVDTNFLVRMLTNDQPDSAVFAYERVSTYGANEISIADYVLVELTFVLKVWPAYKWSRQTISHGLEELLHISQFVMSHDAQKAIINYKTHPKLDFVDCLLLAKSQLDDETILTFDKDLLKVLNT